MIKPFMHKDLVEAGCDEAGRGCLAGPVFAASVILPKSFYHPVLNDSKKLSERHREMLREVIVRESIDWKVAQIDNKTIDDLNILRASILAMHQAIKGLKVVPQYLLIDGNRFYSYGTIMYSTIVGGDGIYASIAAASVLAKCFRDDYMRNLHNEYPEYGWDRNKGYGTVLHRKAIMEHGITPYHRRSFTLDNRQGSFDF